MSTDNTIFTLRAALAATGHDIAQELLEELLLSHPQYPSLQSISDTLTHLGVKHHAIRVAPEELPLVSWPCIAHLSPSGGQLAILEKNRDGRVAFRTGKGSIKEFTLAEFAKVFSGAVVLIDPNQPRVKRGNGSAQARILLGNMLLPLAVLALGATVIMHTTALTPLASHPFGTRELLMLVTKLLGTGVAAMLVLHELSIPSALTDRICHLTPKTDCNAVLGSKASKLIGPIGLADVGLVYFVSTLTLHTIGSNSLIAWISALALVTPIYTIRAQVKLQKWCPLCLMVQAVIVAEFAMVAGSLGQQQPSLLDLATGFAVFSTTAALWLAYRLYLDATHNGRQQRNAYLALKRQPAVFAALMARGYMGSEVLTQRVIQLGTPNAPLSVLAFLSLQCKHCAAAFGGLRSLLAGNTPASLQLVLAPPVGDDQMKVFKHILNVYSAQGASPTLDLLGDWYGSPSDFTARLTLIEGIGSHAHEQPWEGASRELFERYRVRGTPYVLVNGFELPSAYNPYEIKYYIPEILGLTQRRKGQEAQTVAHP